LGDAQLSSGNAVSAERAYASALELTDGRDAALQRNLGVAQFQQGKAGEAA
jgi:hypothetical protein